MLHLIESILLLLLTAVLGSLTGAEELVYAQVGDTVTLQPPQVDNLDKQYLYWYFGDTNRLQLAWSNPMGGRGAKDKLDQTAAIIWGNLSLSNYSLVIKHIKPEHFGIFVCEVGENRRIKYKLLKLTITKNQALPLVPGEFLSLSCTAETPQHIKKPQIHWLNPQEERRETNQVRVKVTGQDNGKWTCAVTNNGRESRAIVSVKVVDFSPPLSRSQYTSKSAPLEVPCSIPASWDEIKAVGIQEVSWHFHPKPRSSSISNEPQRLFYLSLNDPPTWQKDQARDLTPQQVLKKEHVSLPLSLTRKLGKDGDAGDYVCLMKVRNGVTLNRTVHVEVLQITSSPGAEIISGQPVNLMCGLGNPLPSDLRLKWVPPERSSLTPLTPDHQPPYLTIPEVGEGDGGKWRCELWHDNERLTFAEITLKIVPRLSVWMLVIICSVTVIVVLLLLILAFIIYRRRQRKTTHLRHRLCKCKNPKPKGFYRT